MASGVGVTYELEFVIKDKNAKQWIQSMQKEAERLAKALDKVTLNILINRFSTCRSICSTKEIN